MRKLHKASFIGMLLISLSCSVAASPVGVEGIVTSHYEVGCSSDKVSVTVQDNDFSNVVVIHAFQHERLFNVTVESTLLTDEMIDEAIVEAVKTADVITAKLLPIEVGWRF